MVKRGDDFRAHLEGMPKAALINYILKRVYRHRNIMLADLYFEYWDYVSQQTLAKRQVILDALKEANSFEERMELHAQFDALERTDSPADKLYDKIDAARRGEL